MSIHVETALKKEQYIEVNVSAKNADIIPIFQQKAREPFYEMAGSTPGNQNRLGSVELAEGYRIQCGRCGQRCDDKARGVQAFQLFVLIGIGSTFHVILSVVSTMTAAHPARVGRTRFGAGYLPNRGGKRREDVFGGRKLVTNISGFQHDR
jgi:hypothetical protein